MGEAWDAAKWMHGKLWGAQKGVFNAVKDFGFSRRDSLLSHLGLKSQKSEKRSRNTTDEAVGGKVLDARPNVKQQKITQAGQNPSHTIVQEQSSMPMPYGMSRRVYRNRFGKTYRKPIYSLRKAQRGYVRRSGLWRTNGASVQNEKKYHDGTQVQYGVATGGDLPMATMLEIPQNTSQSGRIGKTIHVKDLFVRYELGIAAGAAAVGSDIVRVMIIKDKQCNGTSPAILDILNQATVDSFNKLENKYRFQVLYDETHSLNAPGGDGTNTVRQILQCRASKNLKNMPMEYSGVTGAIGEVRSNNIFMLTIAKYGSATFSCKWRARYYG